MKKIVSLVLAGILCISLFAGCGDQTPETTREMPKVVEGGKHDYDAFDVTVDDFKNQFNVSKVSEIELIKVHETDPERANEYNKVECFDVPENFELAVVTRADGKIKETHVILLNKDQRDSKEFKTFKKYIESMIRWVNPKATSKDIKTYFEKLNVDDKNANDMSYKDPITGFEFYYSVVDNDLGFVISPKG